MSKLALVIAALLSLSHHPQPAADDYVAMAKYWKCGQYMNTWHIHGYIAIEKYTPVVYYHGTGPVPYNVVSQCAR